MNSRTILDAIGAERLLGNGDMLFMPPDASKLQRLHGAYISDAEIQNITDFVRKQEPQHYQMDLLQDEEEEVEGSESSGEEEYDTMYDDAVRVVTESGKASISYVQRRLQVGYNRAAPMIECMEREGVVSTADHRGAREVLAQNRNRSDPRAKCRRRDASGRASASFCFCWRFPPVDSARPPRTSCARSRTATTRRRTSPPTSRRRCASRRAGRSSSRAARSGSSAPAACTGSTCRRRSRPSSPTARRCGSCSRPTTRC